MQLERRDRSDLAQRPYLPVLIRLFGRASTLPPPGFWAEPPHQIVDDAEAEFLTFLAGKTVGMIRAPDEFVYPAPFNLFEVFIAPFE